MMMWLMSDRAIPRSYRMMQGFGVHTFRFVNAERQGHVREVPLEAQARRALAGVGRGAGVPGRDPDFNRRDLWDAIEAGEYPEWELGVQLVPEEDEFAFDFDLLDATKLIPEEQVPVRPDRPTWSWTATRDNFFAETEQVAFHTANVVPGIDFTNDPLLQARNFSYLDTQLIRLGGPNFAQIPVNQPVAPVRTNHRDGYHQGTIHRPAPTTPPTPSAAAAPPSPERDGTPTPTTRSASTATRSASAAPASRTTTARPPCSGTAWATGSSEHIVDAFRFELGKVGTVRVRDRTVNELAHIDYGLATEVAEGIGIANPDTGPRQHKPTASPALSLDNLARRPLHPHPHRRGPRHGRRGRRTARPGEGGARRRGRRRRSARGPRRQGARQRRQRLRGRPRPADRRLRPVRRRPAARRSPRHPVLAADPAAMRFVRDAYRHGKPIGALGSGVGLVTALAPTASASRLGSTTWSLRPGRGHGHDDGRGERGVHPGLRRR